MFKHFGLTAYELILQESQCLGRDAWFGFFRNWEASDLWACVCVAPHCRGLMWYCRLTRSCATIKEEPPVKKLISHRKDLILDLENIVSEIRPAKCFPTATLFHPHSCFEMVPKNKSCRFPDFLLRNFMRDTTKKNTWELDQTSSPGTLLLPILCGAAMRDGCYVNCAGKKKQTRQTAKVWGRFCQREAEYRRITLAELVLPLHAIAWQEHKTEV